MIAFDVAFFLLGGFAGFALALRVEQKWLDDAFWNGWEAYRKVVRAEYEMRQEEGAE